MCSAEDLIKEILIVDGGSIDGTQDIIHSFSVQQDITIRFISSEKGRAKQMNTGAKETTSEILYFLHADSFPPPAFDQLIVTKVKNGDAAGCFRMKFDHNHWWLKIIGWFTQFSGRACRGGDQSQFITKNLFEELGGFNESYIIYEDHDLINRLYARNQFVVIQEWLITSARRYLDHGIWTLQFHFLTIYIKKWRGAGPEDLYQYYKENIAK
ncbi:TIGR04283 family arsenosugar biosynthesis glycosyltransferase [Aquimarina addita]|uniref:TIGR04283 family arsenosugar biosynthesis glycosyltransferase n=2 Tax=Aquimarina addita TaxID=870485 RepID=A0ABP6USL0_9FLAO